MTDDLTEHDDPEAGVAPADDPDDRPLAGSVTLIAEDDEAYYSTGERWDAEPDATGDQGREAPGLR